MRISDWSSDVCSSDLQRAADQSLQRRRHQRRDRQGAVDAQGGTDRALAADVRECTRPRCGVVAQALHRGAGGGVTPSEDACAPAQEIGRAHVELQSLMRISYAVFCLKKTKEKKKNNTI